MLQILTSFYRISQQLQNKVIPIRLKLYYQKFTSIQEVIIVMIYIGKILLHNLRKEEKYLQKTLYYTNISIALGVHQINSLQILILKQLQCRDQDGHGLLLTDRPKSYLFLQHLIMTQLNLSITILYQLQMSGNMLIIQNIKT